MSTNSKIFNMLMCCYYGVKNPFYVDVKNTIYRLAATLKVTLSDKDFVEIIHKFSRNVHMIY